MITYIFFAIAVALLTLFIAFLWHRNRQLNSVIDSMSGELQDERLSSAVIGERLAASVERQREVEQQKADLLAMFNTERVAMSEQFTHKFNVLANEILENKSRTMSTQNSDTINAILRPFGEKIDKFRERIEQESKQRYALENEVKRLAELNMQMSREANNLTAALRGNSKSQGDWGEMILETLLENSGLKRDIHFRIQETIRDAQGQLLRPDVVLCLPDEKEVIIDSKVSLTAYVAYCESEDELSAKRALAAHVLSVKSHITELGKKSYQKLVASPDFVIMFVPNEPAFLLALQGDSAIWDEAYQKGVILSSPTNLFAILRIVDDLWRRDSQSKNALEIARQGGDLYDKFVGFVETLSDVGRAIKRSDELYEKGISQLSSGAGNLVRRAETLRKLGVKASKKLPAQLSDNDEILNVSSEN